MIHPDPNSPLLLSCFVIVVPIPKWIGLQIRCLGEELLYNSFHSLLFTSLSKQKLRKTYILKDNQFFRSKGQDFTACFCDQEVIFDPHTRETFDINTWLIC